MKESNFGRRVKWDWKGHYTCDEATRITRIEREKMKSIEQWIFPVPLPIADFYCKVSHLPRERTQHIHLFYCWQVLQIDSSSISLPDGATALFPYQHPAASSCAGSWWSASWWRPCPGVRSRCGAGAAGEPAHRTLPTPCSSGTGLHPLTSLSCVQS